MYKVPCAFCGRHMNVDRDSFVSAVLSEYPALYCSEACYKRMQEILRALKLKPGNTLERRDH